MQSIFPTWRDKPIFDLEQYNFKSCGQISMKFLRWVGLRQGIINIMKLIMDQCFLFYRIEERHFRY